MPASRFFSTPLQASAKNVPRARIRQRTQLDKEELAVLRVSRRNASGRYQDAIREACTVIEQKIAAIAQAHGKSVNRVRADVHMAPRVSLNRHSRRSPWNAFMWMQSKKEKENNVENGKFYLAT